jgi:hypothetical protein
VGFSNKKWMGTLHRISKGRGFIMAAKKKKAKKSKNKKKK